MIIRLFLISIFYKVDCYRSKPRHPMRFDVIDTRDMSNIVKEYDSLDKITIDNVEILTLDSETKKKFQNMKNEIISAGYNSDNLNKLFDLTMSNATDIGKVISTMKYFGSGELTYHEVMRLIDMVPELVIRPESISNLVKTLINYSKEKHEELNEKELKRIILSCPRLVYKGVELAKKRIRELEIIGIDVIDGIRSFPRLLNIGEPLKKARHEAIVLGLPIKTIHKMISKWPRLLSYEVEGNLRRKKIFLQDFLKISIEFTIEIPSYYSCSIERLYTRYVSLANKYERENNLHKNSWFRLGYNPDLNIVDLKSFFVPNDKLFAKLNNLTVKDIWDAREIVKLLPTIREIDAVKPKNIKIDRKLGKFTQIDYKYFKKNK